MLSTSMKKLTHPPHGTNVFVDSALRSTVETGMDGGLCVVIDNLSLASPVPSSGVLSAESSVTSISTHEFSMVRKWCGKKFVSDLIQDGMAYLGEHNPDVIMVYESPTSTDAKAAFYSSETFLYHDYPPSNSIVNAVLRPLRYATMNGKTYPCFLSQDESSITGLLRHWKESLPDHALPTFVSEISDKAKVNAYLPVEVLKLDNHVQDPYTHFFLAGKDAIPLMTARTTKLLPNTRDHRPCVAKVTHAMGSKGIFVIRNDADESEFKQFLSDTGDPKYVVTEFVDASRNVACHFFIHPNGSIIWFGSNENMRMRNGEFSTDSYFDMSTQDELRETQLPFVQDVVQYCRSVGFWGMCGIDVLFDAAGKGYVVDMNPRATGTCPALMTAQLLQARHGFRYGVFRRSAAYPYPGPASELLERVKTFNEENLDRCRVVIYSLHENNTQETLLNLAVFGQSKVQIHDALDFFSPKPGYANPFDDGLGDERS